MTLTGRLSVGLPRRDWLVVALSGRYSPVAQIPWVTVKSGRELLLHAPERTSNLEAARLRSAYQVQRRFSAGNAPDSLGDQLGPRFKLPSVHPDRCGVISTFGGA